MIRLETSIEPQIDPASLAYYVTAGQPFDAEQFAQSQGLDARALDGDDVAAAARQAAGLKPGQYLRIDYSEG